MTEGPPDVGSAEGRLGVLLPGMGAVATTTIAGVHLARKGLAQPIGSLTQLNTIRLGQRTDNRTPLIKDFIGLVGLDDIVFGGWDPIPDNAYESAVNAGVLSAKHLDPIKDELSAIKPMTAAFDTEYVTRLDGPNKKTGANKREIAEEIREDILMFKEENGCDRLVMVWCGSTEIFLRPGPAHETMDSFEKAMEANDPAIAPSMLYAYAALQEGIPYANGAPNLSADFPAFEDYSTENGIPICGKDFKTGQTLMKTILAPGFKARMLGVAGWFSTNILGNRDGEVLEDPGSFKSKEVSKLSVLEHILQPEKYPELYGDMHHVVRINYYPPRGDNKEGWDNIDIKGWLGYPMQIKINFLCRDSILAAPLVLDLALFMDLASRAGESGIQEWLSFYFKAPQGGPAGPEHDLFIQQTKLKNTLREWMGESPVTHSEAG